MPLVESHINSLSIETLAWRHVEVSGAPPPSRLDHAMCAINIPIPSSTSAQEKPVHSTTFSSVETRTQHSLSGGSLSTESSQTSSSSFATTSQSGGTSQSSSSGFQAVTVIDPEDTSSANFTVSQSLGVPLNGDEVAEKLQGLHVKEKEEEGAEQYEWVPALFVFGGMDTTGIVHGDAFILVP